MNKPEDFRSATPILDRLIVEDAQRVTFELRQRTQETLDAERYRYLRDRALLLEDGPAVCQGLSDLFEFLHGADVDEAVDAAIAATKNKP